MQLNTLRRLARVWLWPLLLCYSCLFWAPPACATVSLMVEAPQQVIAGEQCQFAVVGDQLQHVVLRFYKLRGTTSPAGAGNPFGLGVGTGSASPRPLVVALPYSNSVPQSWVPFNVTLPAAGDYQVEAASYARDPAGLSNQIPPTATNDLTVTCQDPDPDLPTLDLEASDDISPPGPTDFQSTGNKLETAILTVWKLRPTGGESVCFTQRGYMPPPPPANSPDAANYNPAILWTVNLPAGVYLAEARSGALRAMHVVHVDDLGLLSKRSPHGLLVYVVRLTTGRPIPGAAVRMDDPGYTIPNPSGSYPPTIVVRPAGPSRGGLTGPDGATQFDGTPINGNLLVSVSAPDGGRVQNHESAAPDLSQNNYRLYSYTDRPLYRPGQTVYYKAILRRDLAQMGLRSAVGALYEPVPDMPVTMTITDSQDRQVEKDTDVLTDAKGDLTGHLDLAPDAAVGMYSVEFDLPSPTNCGPIQFFNRFNVAEYRKPEFEVNVAPQLARPYALQGEPFDVVVSAHYYWGGPLVGAKLQMDGVDGGPVKLDANGEARFHMENPVTPDQAQLKTFTFNAQVTDISNRIVASSSTVASYFANLKVDISPARAAYYVKDTGALNVVTTDPIGDPVSTTVRVRVFHFRGEDRKDPETLSTVHVEQKTSFFDTTVTTNAYGRGTVTLPLQYAGYLDATADATDAAGHAVTADCRIWSMSRTQTDWGDYEFNALEVVTDRDTYSPGDTVHALITSDKTSGIAFVTLQSDRIFWHQTVPLTGHVTEFSFVFPHDAAPGATLDVGYISGTSWTSQTVYVRAIAPEQMLQVQVTPDKKVYRPGETVHYRIAVHDGTGKPCATDLSVGMVDKAIYGLANDETPDPVSFFFDNRPNLVQTAWTFPSEVAGGAYQRIQKSVPVRREFRDTAFWNPLVTTDAAGNATLDVTLPDNLTTWRTTARGITAATQVGVSQSEVAVTKPLLTRLILPRAMVQKDRLQVQVIVQNNTTHALPVQVSLRGTGIDCLPLPELDAHTALGAGGTEPFLTAQMPGGGAQSFWWEIGTDAFPAGGEVKLTATARGGDDPNDLESSDAQELPMPLLPRAVAVSDNFAGAVSADHPESSFVLKAPPGAVAGAGTLKVSIAASVAGPLLRSLPGLLQYPDGSTEDTLSRFVPALAAAQTYKRLKLPAPAELAQMDTIFSQSRATLYTYQHSDGGWGWWPDDNTDPDLTAYAIYGLSLAHAAGYTVDRGKMQNGVKNLLSQFGDPDLAPDDRAYMMLAYASAKQEWGFVDSYDLHVTDDFPKAVFQQSAQLTPYGLATLAIAELRLGHKTEASQLLDQLEKDVHYEDAVDGRVALWSSPDAPVGSWLDAPLETTAFALQALVEGRPDSPAILPAVKRLMRSREGDTWESTRETAQIVTALCAYLERSKELTPAETLNVSASGKPLGSMVLTPRDVYRMLPGYELNPCDGDAPVTVRRSGTGSVYFSAQLRNFETTTLETGAENGIRIERHFQIRNAKGWWRDVDGPIPSGADVRVDLRLVTGRPMNFLMVQSPAPAGFEARPEDDDQANIIERHADCVLDSMVQTDPPLDWQPLPISRRDDRDAGLVYFIDHLEAGQYYARYILRPEQVGQMLALPASVSPVYHPSINGRTPATQLEVK